MSESVVTFSAGYQSTDKHDTTGICQIDVPILDVPDSEAALVSDLGGGWMKSTLKHTFMVGSEHLLLFDE